MGNKSLIAGTFNFRDLGGLPLADGGSTAHGVVYRADALGAVDVFGQTQLEHLNIGTIFDLRSAEEREQVPDVPVAGAENVALPMLAGDMKRLAESAADGTLPAVPQLRDLYISLLDNQGDEFVRIARTVASGDSATVVHCTAGKDRTGVTAAILLAAAGVGADDIVANYAETEANLAEEWAPHMLEVVASFGVELTDELKTLVTASPADEMRATLEYLDTRLGGVEKYLLDSGLTADELASLRARLIATD